jgi:peptidyl-prolyl cis-trans isomerase SurA
MKKTILAVTIALTAVSASAAQVIEGIVIRVGDRIVTRTQYERRLADALREVDQNSAVADAPARKEVVRKNLPNEMVSELLIRDRADRLNITVTDTEVKESINRLKAQYNIQNDEQFNESLKQSGLTRPEMENRLRETLISNKVFARELRNREDISDPELRERYNREKEQYRLPERARLREIVILRPDDAAKADEARQRAADVAAAALKPGTDFGNLASTMSEAGSKEKSGELGEVAKGDLVSELDKAVFNSASGAVVGPIETKSAWHIIKVEQRLPSEVPAFESIKDRLRKEAGEESFQRDFKAYVESLRKDAFIQINDEMIPKA